MKRRTITMGLTLAVLTITLIIQMITGQESEWVMTPGNTEAGPRYKIEAQFDEETMGLKAEEKITIANQQEVSFEELYFHIYPNVYMTEETAPFSIVERELAYYDGFSSGSLDVKEVQVNKQKAAYKIMGKTNTLLRITLPELLRPAQEVEIFISFEVKLPHVMGRTGYGPHTVNLTKWYPILAVYDSNGWNLDPYYAIGDPFYSEVGTYDVIISFPEGYQAAHTGNLINEQLNEGRITYEVRAERVRDFALVLSKEFIRDFALVEGTEVRAFSLTEEKRKEALQYGVDALTIFNQLYGKYPYEQLSVVAADFHLGGMEYPNLVMISQSLYTLEEDFPLEYVIAHEVAHQWWYGLVGNNEVKEPWLDEALTEYSTLLYFEEKYGAHIKEQIMEKVVTQQYEEFAGAAEIQPGILRGIDEFDTGSSYSSIVYSKGALFFEALRQEMGDEAFFHSLRQYFETYQFQNTTAADLLEICLAHGDESLKELFDEWLVR